MADDPQAIAFCDLHGTFWSGHIRCPACEKAMTASKASEPTPRTDAARNECHLFDGQLRAMKLESLLELSCTLERDLQKAEARAADLEQIEKSSHEYALACEKRAAEAERKVREWQDSMECVGVACRAKALLERAQVAELDAGRYRWLRMQGGNRGRVSVIQWEPGNKERDGSTIRAEELDSYVDVALRPSAP